MPLQKCAPHAAVLTQKRSDEVVMNHMANEFFFDGHEYTQAPFRFHEEGGLREYLLQARKEPWLSFVTPFGQEQCCC